MKKTAIAAIILTAGLVGFSRNQTPAPVPTATTTPIPSVSYTPLLAPYIRVGLITGATAEETQMIRTGEALVNKVMATPCFKAQVLAARYTENNGMTQEQIWQTLISGPVLVNADMFTGSWTQNHISHTIGYEVERGTVHMNRYFVNSAYMVGDNLAHEGEGHSQGFGHDHIKSTSEPYGMNKAYEACAQQQQQATVKKPARPHVRMFLKDRRKPKAQRCMDSKGQRIADCA